ncbi:hypothetical protein PoMZ_07106, partial [Pyricularia oryzae]
RKLKNKNSKLALYLILCTLSGIALLLQLQYHTFVPFSTVLRFDRPTAHNFPGNLDSKHTQLFGRYPDYSSFLQSQHLIATVLLCSSRDKACTCRLDRPTRDQNLTLFHQKSPTTILRYTPASRQD